MALKCLAARAAAKPANLLKLFHIQPRQYYHKNLLTKYAKLTNNIIHFMELSCLFAEEICE
jgi:hypothetical protein